MKEIKLKVNEIFYSIQGEGANAGMPAIFIRLSGCNLQCDFCDTQHGIYTEMSIEQIREKIEEYNCKNIVWTGGEPLLQLDSEILTYFSKLDYVHILETNGTIELPNFPFKYVSCSPKTNNIKAQNMRIDEFRFPIKVGDKIPNIRTTTGKNHYLSPIDVSKKNIEYCIKLIKENPQWKLSVQMHKILKIQ